MTIAFKEALQLLIDHHDLTHEQMLAVMHQIMSGAYTPAQIASLLIGLRVKGETVEEIAAAAEVMRDFRPDGYWGKSTRGPSRRLAFRRGIPAIRPPPSTLGRAPLGRAGDAAYSEKRPIAPPP